MDLQKGYDDATQMFRITNGDYRHEYRYLVEPEVFVRSDLTAPGKLVGYVFPIRLISGLIHARVWDHERGGPPVWIPLSPVIG